MSGVSLFSAVSSEEMHAAQVVTGAAMAAFVVAGLIPGLRRHAPTIRGILLVVYLVTCAAFVDYVLTR